MENASNHKSKVTRQHVEAALQEFESKGISNPGAQRLREKIGFGNVARIQRLKDEIKAEQAAERRGLEKYPLPEDITKETHKLYVQLMEAVEAAQIEKEKEAIKETGELRQKIEVMKDAEAVLVGTISKLENERDSLTNDLSDAQEEAGSLNKQLKRAHDQIAALTGSLKQLDKQTGDTIADLRTRVTELNQIRNKNDEAREREVAGLNSQLSSLETRFEKENGALRTENDKLTGALDKEKTTRGELESSLKTALAHEKELESQVKRLEKTVTENEGEIKAVNDSNASITNELTRLKGDLKAEIEKGKVQASHIDTLNGVIANTNKHVEELTDKINKED